MKYADTIRAAGLEVEPLMSWFLPWVRWSNPHEFDRFLEKINGMDFRLRGSKQLRAFDSTRYVDFLDVAGNVDRIIVEPKRDVAILRIVPRNDPGYLVQPDKVGLLVAVDTEKDVLVETRLLCQYASKDWPVSGDNIVAYVFPDPRDPMLVMGIDPPKVGDQFGWEIKKGEVVIVERFRTIGDFSLHYGTFPGLEGSHPASLKRSDHADPNASAE